jgi:C4-dicarboxylate transporter, DctM subunit
MLATTLLLLLGLLAISVPVAAVMGVLGLALNDMYAFMPLQRAMGEIIWNASSEYILIAIPLALPSASTTRLRNGCRGCRAG